MAYYYMKKFQEEVNAELDELYQQEIQNMLHDREMGNMKENKTTEQTIDISLTLEQTNECSTQL